MGLIQKLNEIKTIKNDIKDAIVEKGGVLEDTTPFENYAGIIQNLQTEDETDYTDINTEYLCYNMNNPNLVKFLCDNMYKNEQNKYYYTFANCKVDVSDIFKVKPYYKVKPMISDGSYYYPFGTGGYFYNSIEKTFYYYKYENLNLVFDEYLPTYFYNTFDHSSIVKLSTNLENIWVGHGGSVFTYCSKLTEVPKINLEKCDTLSSMFSSCSKLKKVEFTGRPFVANYEKGKHISFGESASQPSMSSMFYGCSSLESVKGLDLTYVNSNIPITNMFYGCTKLKELDFTGTEDFRRIDISGTGLDRDGLMNMLATLPQLDHTATIKIGDTKLAMLSDEDIAEFTLKGYSLAGSLTILT